MAGTILFINPKSRSGVGVQRAIEASCAQHGIEISEVVRMSRGDDLHKVVRKIVRKSPTLLLAAGGDGTISEVVDELVGTRIQLGVIPLGTTNNFARSLGIPFGIDDAIKTIARGRTKKIDLGKIGADYFANVTSIGISAEIARSVTNKMKQRYGRLAYALVGLSKLIHHKPFFVKVRDVKGNMEFSIETHQLVIANGKYHAGKVVAEEAALDSRELLVFPLGGKSRLSLLLHMIDFYSGRRRSIRHATYLIAKHVIITTDRKQLVEIDGESKIKTPITVKVESDAVTVRV